jgi:hypothetical protein
MHRKFWVTEYMGFDNFSDFVVTTLTIKEKTMIPLLSIILSISLSAVSGFVDEVIYTPAAGIVILGVANLIDTILGASAAIREKLGLDANKLVRSGVRFLVQTVFVAIFWNLHQVHPILIRKEIVDALLLIFTLSTVWSSIKNAFRLDLLTKDQYDTIESLIGLKLVIDKLRGKKK